MMLNSCNPIYKEIYGSHNGNYWADLESQELNSNNLPTTAQFPGIYSAQFCSLKKIVWLMFDLQLH